MHETVRRRPQGSSSLFHHEGLICLRTRCAKKSTIAAAAFLAPRPWVSPPAQLGMTDFTHAETKRTALPAIKPGTNTSFGSLKQTDAGLLNVGYAEAGPADGPAVILLRGWPYDIYSFVDVAPLLASAGYRVIVQRPNINNGTNIILLTDSARSATTNSGTTSRSSFGSSLRPKWNFDDATFDRTAARRLRTPIIAAVCIGDTSFANASRKQPRSTQVTRRSRALALHSASLDIIR